jgi:hypothetical protein
MAALTSEETERPPGLPDRPGVFDRLGPRLAVLLAVALVVFLRVPEILLEGRFWAEGGTVYFQAAVHNPWAETFFDPFGGYYSLLNRLGAEAATWVPLEAAPLVTGYLSFAALLLPSLMILFLPNRLGILGWRRCLLGALIAFPTMGAEVWLNLVNNQFWLGVAAGLVLMIDTRERWTIWFLAPVLVIAVLTGPVATFLLPFFLLIAVIEKDRTFIRLTLIVCAGALLQGFLMFDTISGDHPRTGLAQLPAQVFAGQMKLFLYPFLAEHAAAVFDAAKRADIALLGAALAASLAIAAFCFWHALSLPRPQGLLLFASIFVVSGLSLVGSIGFPLDDWSVFLHVISGGRYFLYGNLILLVLLMAPSLGKGSRVKNLAALVLVALFINSAQWSYFHARWAGPSWPDEVEA